MTTEQKTALLARLEERFEANMDRHNGIVWADIQAKLEKDAGKLSALGEMEKTGGEPDVVGHNLRTNVYSFVDCSPESPAGRRNLCYDREALEARKSNKPQNSAISLAAAMGIAVLTEEQYRALQQLGEFDTKTSSWVVTPKQIRDLGGALFCDRRYNQVFTYHNGAESYYASRGFRGVLEV